MDNHRSSPDIALQNNGDVGNSNSTDVILPNCTDLDWDQIIYAINYKRLLFIHRFQTWSSFHTENSDNAFKYSDYTVEELSHRFLYKVLPNIFEYELTPDELYLLNLLNLHPNFEKTGTGFKFRERTKHSDEAAINTLTTTDILQKQKNFVGSTAKLNNQIVTVGTGEQQNLIRGQFSFNAENVALLSVALRSDEELPNCELLTIAEMFERLKAAKRQFEDNGRHPENAKISLDDLLKKVHTISKLKEAVAKLVDSGFCQ